MTPKIEKFLAERRPETPCLVIDLDSVRANYQTLADALPSAEIYYAVKANPASPVLETLADLGSSFDAASVEEIRRCLASGAAPDRIAYGNTIKKQADIAKAYGLGVRLFAFDSAEELDKLVEAAPGAKVFCRLLLEETGAAWPLSRKFGCAVDMAIDLLKDADARGLEAHGISFHVGSQQTDVRQWDIAVGKAAMVFTALEEAGITLKLLNLGGGFPVRYSRDVPDVDRVATAIQDSLMRHFGNRLPATMIEPGRYIAANAGVLRSEVVLVSTKAYGEDRRWVYLDVGMFGGLAETMNEAIKYELRASCGGAEGPVVVAGPTCDGADILYEKTDYRLPVALRATDTVDVLGAGAYTATYASVGFNGFPPLKEYYV